MKKIKAFFKRIKDSISKFIKFITVEYKSTDSVFQWVIKQFIILDSTTGNPSWTTTISVAIAIFTFVLIYFNIQLAFLPEKTFDPTTGKLIKIAYKGFTTEFWVFMGSVFAIVSYLYKNRIHNTSEEPIANVDSNIIETVKNTAENIIEKIRK
jgi:hypothetical protein